jgi:hypothetical protein
MGGRIVDFRRYSRYHRVSQWRDNVLVSAKNRPFAIGQCYERGIPARTLHRRVRTDGVRGPPEKGRIVVREIALTIDGQITAGGEYGTVPHDRRSTAKKVSRGRVRQHQMRVCAGTQRWVPDVVYKLSALVATGIGAIVHHPTPRQKDDVNSMPRQDQILQRHVPQGHHLGSGRSRNSSSACAKWRASLTIAWQPAGKRTATASAVRAAKCDAFFFVQRANIVRISITSAWLAPSETEADE